MSKKPFLISIALAVAVVIAGCGQVSADKPESTAGKTSQALETSLEGQKSYTVVRVDGEPDWDSIPQIDIDSQQWLDPVDISAHAQLCYDNESFYVRMWAEEAEIRAEYPESDLLANVYEDSCLEFFICPVPEDPRYMNFEANPNCAMGVEIGTVKTNRTRLVRSDNPYEATSSRDEDGWEISYKIPFSFIETLYPDFSAESGMQLRGNFYKCGNLTANKHYIAWNPIESDTPNFHMPECFGILILE